MSKITEQTQLRDLYKMPSDRAANKSIYKLDDHARRFIELASYFTISSIDENGFIDTSPKGGEPGFVKVVGENEILFPDSRGNNRLDTFHNVLANSKVGLMFLVQGVDETLRLKGSVTLLDDEESLGLVSDAKFRPTIAVKVTVTELFFHCGKAAMRSQLWDAGYKIDRTEFPSIAKIMKDQQNLVEQPISQEEIEKHYRETL